MIDPYRKGKRLLRDEHPLYVRYRNYSFDCRKGLVTDDEKVYRLKERRKMIRDAKRFSEKDLFSVKLFGEERYLDLFRNPEKMQVRFALPRIPFGEDSVYQSTLLFTSRRKVCRRIELLDLHLRFNESLPYPSLPFDTSSVRYPRVTKKKVLRDTVRRKIPFRRRLKKVPMDSLRSILREKRKGDWRIDSLEVMVTASLEGTKEKNRDLLKARKEHVSKKLDPLFPERSPSIRIDTLVDVEMFRRDLRGSSLDSLADRSKDSLRDHVNAHSEDPLIDSLLFRQRYITLRAVRKRVRVDSLDIEAMNRRMIDRFNQLLGGLGLSSKKDYEIRSMVDEMVKIQKVLQKGYLEGHVRRRELEGLKTRKVLERIGVKTPQLLRIRYRELMFRYLVLEELRTPDMFKRLQGLARLKVPSEKGDGRIRALEELDRDRVQRFVTSNALLLLRPYPLAASDPERFLLCFPDGDLTARRSLCRDRREGEAGPERAMQNINAFAQWRGVTEVPDDSLERMEAFYHVQSLRLIFPLVEEHEQEVRKHVRALERYYARGDRLSRERRVRLAKFIYAFQRNEAALRVLDPLLEGKDPYAPAIGLALRIETEGIMKENEMAEVLREYLAKYSQERFCKSLKVFWTEGGDLRKLRAWKTRELVCSTCSMHLD